MENELTAIEVVTEWRRRLSNNDFSAMHEIVDVENYTENCLGLTGWTTGFQVAAQNFFKNMVMPWADAKVTQKDQVANQTTVVTRYNTEATHIGEFIGIPATGRRISYATITIVNVKDGKVIGQWVQADLHGIQKQLQA